MRWNNRTGLQASPNALPGLERERDLVRSVQAPDFAGVTFHEVLARSALNRVPGGSEMPFAWTVNPYRGCTHACVYCFARPTHSYLELDAGAGFDSQIVVKVNVAEVLERELLKPSWGREHVALGTNTDPYQRAEGKYRLMPGIIDAFVRSGTPFSILTKGTLLRRDLPALAAAADRDPVDIGLSIAVFDEELQRSVEPGTPSTAARLATVSAVRDAGLDCTVFLMPLLPGLTDSDEMLEDAVARLAAAGATAVQFGALHLKPGVKPWYMHWLERNHPQLVGLYRELYADGPYLPAAYAADLRARMQRLLDRHGLGDGRAGPTQRFGDGARRRVRFDGFDGVEGSRSRGAARRGVSMAGSVAGPARTPDERPTALF
ncbi:Rv2578c family radical SAM protein [Mycetocola reblochoni]|uniref:Rv2578c family radical SAM protein n=1 Tax=Mycetocola reblochoni TaxID=331618 RepID=UPI003F97C382